MIYLYINLLIALMLFVAVLYFLTGILNAIHLFPKKYDYIVVLGAGLIGDKVPPLLASRINRGIRLYKKQPHAKMIFSGGQGSDELVSEARAMADYALLHGVRPEDVILEDRSTSTEENIEFSKALMTVRNPKVAIVTNHYHVLRALIIAKEQKLRCDGYGGKTKFYYSLNASIREFIGYLYVKRNFYLRLWVGITVLYVLMTAMRYGFHFYG